MNGENDMPAKDIYHDTVKAALINDGWTITHDPLGLTFGRKNLYVDLGAERLIAASKEDQKIAVEVKSFIGKSEVDDSEMDSLIKKHAEIVKKVLSYYAQFKPSHGEIEVETVFDDTHQHYEMVNVGWDGVRRVHGSVIHVDIKQDGKIWIQHDGTESGIVDDLLVAGVPKDQIVLAFYSPRKRVHTEFAVS